MFRKRRNKLVGLALGLGLLAAAPATASPIVTVPESLARSTVYPSTPTVTVPESWARIRVYPNTPTVTVPESWARITVYPSTLLAAGTTGTPAEYARMTQRWVEQNPGTSSLPTVHVTPYAGGSSNNSLDFASAGVGAGFIVGLGALALGGALALRRRRLVHA
jgi:hypothetical protein